MDEFTRFNQTVYSSRKDVKKRFSWLIKENPLATDDDYSNVLLISKNDEEIVGQFVLIPFKCYYNDESWTGHWGIDWFVHGNYRGHGPILVRRAIKNFDPYFAMGVSSAAKPVLEALRVKPIGSIAKYIWFRSPIPAARLYADHILKRTPKKPVSSVRQPTFPLSLTAGGIEFHLEKNLDGWKDPHWKDTFTTSRPPEFLKWRFLEGYQDHRIYMSSDKKSYLAVRMCFWRGLKILVLSDYRISYLNTKHAQAIMKASKLLASKMRLDGVITGSTHSFFDGEFKRARFRKIGNEGLIMTSAKLGISDDNILKRNAAYVTMADCDVDLNFGVPL